VRRRALEASIRAPRDWHQSAVRTAYATNDQEWQLTAVYCMQWVKGFRKEILEALNSRNPDIHREAVRAAGNWEVHEAWPHVAALLASPKTSKKMLLAAIEAAPNVNREEAGPALMDLADSTDEEIAEAADEAMSMAAIDIGDEFDEEEN
jgi:hypothetical protein